MSTKSRAAANTRRERQKGSKDQTARKEARVVLKERVKKTKELSQGDMLLRAEGGQGTNSLSQSSHVVPQSTDILTVPGVDPTTDIVVKVTDRSLLYLAMGICLRAIKRGWSTQQNLGDGSVFYSFKYLYDTFLAATEGTVPLIQQAPWWFWEIIHAMRPKTEKFKTGQMGYTTSVVLTGQAANDVFTLSNSEQFVLFWGAPYSGMFVNGYPILAPPQLPYTAELGAKSVQGLFTFFNSLGLSKRTGDPGDKAWMTHDTSFFASCYSDIGQSFFAPGGYSMQVYSEREVTAPIFAKFANWEGEGDETAVWRGSHRFVRNAGSPCYIGPRLSEMSHPKELYNKGEVLYKIYNFDKFVERLALTIALALESEAARPNLSGVVIPSCPLSTQDFHVLLRQSLVPYFSNEMAQDLRMSSDAGAKRTVTMLPFTVGPNGASFTAQSETPLFPKFFAESVRACSRFLYSPSRKDGKKGDPGHGRVIDFVPVLSRPSDYAPVPNYTFMTPEGAQTLFTVKPLQLPINMVDCSVQDGQNTYYLDLNGQTLQSNIAEWNTWLKQRIALTGLTSLGTEQGISALNANIYTTQDRLLEPAPVAGASAALLKKKPSLKGPKMIGSLPKRYGAVGVEPGGPDYLQDTLLLSVTSQLPFTSAIWKYAQHMTLPSFIVTAAEGSGSLPLYQTNMIEPYNLPLAGLVPEGAIDFFAAPAQVSSYTHCLASANLDIRPPLNNGKSEMEVDMDSLAESGRGGIFCDIAAALSDAFGAHGVSQVIRTVGKVTGW
jgi:hypothetical protein